MERLALYCADWWGMRVVNRQVDLATALAACDQRLFRAFVRLRADKQSNAIHILREERVRPLDYDTVGKALLDWAYDPQADWEKQLGATVTMAGQEICRLQDVQRAAAPLTVARNHDQAAALYAATLDPPPTSASVRAQARLRLAESLILARRYAQVVQQTDAALDDANTTDAFTGETAQPSLMRRILALKVEATLFNNGPDEAVRVAEGLANDPNQPAEVRMQMFFELVNAHLAARQRPEAAQAFQRLQSLGSPG